jgi:hypothetical protein
MAELQGYAAKAAYKPAATWGTAVTLGDGDQVEYATEDVAPEIELVVSDQITGEALPGASDAGSITVQGTLAGMDAKYSNHERFLRAVFGQITTTASGTGFKHKFDFALSNEGEFGTLAFEKVVSGPHEVDSWKPMSLTIVGEANNFVKLDVLGIGRQKRIEDPGRTNDASTTWSLPGIGGAPGVRRLIKFGHTTVQIGPVGGALTSYCLSGFTLNFNRNSEPVQTTCDGDYSSEPSTDTVEISGTFNLPIYDTDNHPLVQARLAASKMKAVITFLHPTDVYDVGLPYKWVIYIPGFQFNAGWPSVGGPGRVPIDFDFTVYNEEANPIDTDASMPRINVFNEIADPDDYTNV